MDSLGKEYEQKAREMEKREAEVARRELRYQASQALKARGLPAEYANLIGAGDEYEMLKVVSAIPASTTPTKVSPATASTEDESDDKYYRRKFPNMRNDPYATSNKPVIRADEYGHMTDDEYYSLLKSKGLMT